MPGRNIFGRKKKSHDISSAVELLLGQGKVLSEILDKNRDKFSQEDLDYLTSEIEGILRSRSWETPRVATIDEDRPPLTEVMPYPEEDDVLNDFEEGYEDFKSSLSRADSILTAKEKNLLSQNMGMLASSVEAAKTFKSDVPDRRIFEASKRVKEYNSIFEKKTKDCLSIFVERYEEILREIRRPASGDRKSSAWKEQEKKRRSALQERKYIAGLIENAKRYVIESKHDTPKDHQDSFKAFQEISKSIYDIKRNKKISLEEKSFLLALQTATEGILSAEKMFLSIDEIRGDVRKGDRAYEGVTLSRKNRLKTFAKRINPINRAREKIVSAVADTVSPSFIMKTNADPCLKSLEKQSEKLKGKRGIVYQTLPPRRRNILDHLNDLSKRLGAGDQFVDYGEGMINLGLGIAGSAIKDYLKSKGVAKYIIPETQEEYKESKESKETLLKRNEQNDIFEVCFHFLENYLFLKEDPDKAHRMGFESIESVSKLAERIAVFIGVDLEALNKIKQHSELVERLLEKGKDRFSSSNPDINQFYNEIYAEKELLAKEDNIGVNLKSLVEMLYNVVSAEEMRESIILGLDSSGAIIEGLPISDKIKKILSDEQKNYISSYGVEGFSQLLMQVMVGEAILDFNDFSESISGYFDDKSLSLELFDTTPSRVAVVERRFEQVFQKNEQYKALVVSEELMEIEKLLRKEKIPEDIFLYNYLLLSKMDLDEEGKDYNPTVAGYLFESVEFIPIKDLYQEYCEINELEFSADITLKDILEDEGFLSNCLAVDFDENQEMIDSLRLLDEDELQKMFSEKEALIHKKEEEYSKKIKSLGNVFISNDLKNRSILDTVNDMSLVSSTEVVELLQQIQGLGAQESCLVKKINDKSVSPEDKIHFRKNLLDIRKETQAVFNTLYSLSNIFDEHLTIDRLEGELLSEYKEMLGSGKVSIERDDFFYEYDDERLSKQPKNIESAVSQVKAALDRNEKRGLRSIFKVATEDPFILSRRADQIKTRKTEKALKIKGGSLHPEVLRKEIDASITFFTQILEKEEDAQLSEKLASTIKDLEDAKTFISDAVLDPSSDELEAYRDMKAVFKQVQLTDFEATESLNFHYTKQWVEQAINDLSKAYQGSHIKGDIERIWKQFQSINWSSKDYIRVKEAEKRDFRALLEEKGYLGELLSSYAYYLDESKPWHRHQEFLENLVPAFKNISRMTGVEYAKPFDKALKQEKEDASAKAKEEIGEELDEIKEKRFFGRRVPDKRYKKYSEWMENYAKDATKIIDKYASILDNIFERDELLELSREIVEIGAQVKSLIKEINKASSDERSALYSILKRLNEKLETKIKSAIEISQEVLSLESNPHFGKITTKFLMAMEHLLSINHRVISMDNLRTQARSFLMVEKEEKQKISKGKKEKFLEASKTVLKAPKKTVEKLKTFAVSKGVDLAVEAGIPKAGHEVFSFFEAADQYIKGKNLTHHSGDVVLDDRQEASGFFDMDIEGILKINFDGSEETSALTKKEILGRDYKIGILLAAELSKIKEIAQNEGGSIDLSFYGFSNIEKLDKCLAVLNKQLGLAASVKTHKLLSLQNVDNLSRLYNQFIDKYINISEQTLGDEDGVTTPISDYIEMQCKALSESGTKSTGLQEVFEIAASAIHENNYLRKTLWAGGKLMEDKINKIHTALDGMEKVGGLSFLPDWIRSPMHELSWGLRNIGQALLYDTAMKRFGQHSKYMIASIAYDLQASQYLRLKSLVETAISGLNLSEDSINQFLEGLGLNVEEFWQELKTDATEQDVREALEAFVLASISNNIEGIIERKVAQEKTSAIVHGITETLLNFEWFDDYDQNETKIQEGLIKISSLLGIRLSELAGERDANRLFSKILRSVQDLSKADFLLLDKKVRCLRYIEKSYNAFSKNIIFGNKKIEIVKMADALGVSVDEIQACIKKEELDKRLFEKLILNAFDRKMPALLDTIDKEIPPAVRVVALYEVRSAYLERQNKNIYDFLQVNAKELGLTKESIKAIEKLPSAQKRFEKRTRDLEAAEVEHFFDAIGELEEENETDYLEVMPAPVADAPTLDTDTFYSLEEQDPEPTYLSVTSDLLDEMSDAISLHSDDSGIDSRSMTHGYDASRTQQENITLEEAIQNYISAPHDNFSSLESSLSKLVEKEGEQAIPIFESTVDFIALDDGIALESEAAAEKIDALKDKGTAFLKAHQERLARKGPGSSSSC